MTETLAYCMYGSSHTNRRPVKTPWRQLLATDTNPVITRHVLDQKDLRSDYVNMQVLTDFGREILSRCDQKNHAGGLWWLAYW